MGDAQGSRVGVDAVSNHAVEHFPVMRNLVTSQQSHYARISVVELQPIITQEVCWLTLTSFSF